MQDRLYFFVLLRARVSFSISCRPVAGGPVSRYDSLPRVYLELTTQKYNVIARRHATTLHSVSDTFHSDMPPMDARAPWVQPVGGSRGLARSAFVSHSHRRTKSHAGLVVAAYNHFRPTRTAHRPKEARRSNPARVSGWVT